MLNRRNVLSGLLGLPFLGFLKPAKAEAEFKMATESKVVTPLIISKSLWDDPLFKTFEELTIKYLEKPSIHYILVRGNPFEGQHYYSNFSIQDRSLEEQAIKEMENRIEQSVSYLKQHSTLEGGEELPIGRPGCGALQKIIHVYGEPFRLTVTYDGSVQGHLFTIEFKHK